MRPRIVLRTHYQADEPRAIIAVVTEASSPTESRHEDVVAASLIRWARRNEYTLSLPGAVYAAGNARALGLLNSTYRWTATGLAFGYMRENVQTPDGKEGLVLAPMEERLYLKTYLENGGALLVKFGRWLIERGETTDDELRSKSIIEKQLVEALDEYLAIVTHVRDRTSIRRQRDRLSALEYASSTKRHKRYPLLTMMRRLHLAVIEETGDGQSVIKPDAEGRLASLLTAFPDVATLERICRAGDLYNAIDRSLLDHNHSNAGIGTPALMSTSYLYAMRRGLQACPLVYLDDLLFAYARNGTGTVALRNANAVFEPLHRQCPGDVRFHVDRRGRRAFLLISDRLFETLEARLSALATSSSPS